MGALPTESTAGRLAAANPDFTVVEAAAAQARGLVDGDRSQLERAVAGHRHPWARASAVEDLAALLSQTTPAQAPAYYSQAAAGYQQAEAPRDVNRIQARLAALGVRQRSSRRSGPLSGWASLTEREMRVVELVAQGLTNPEMADKLHLSRHTIDFHLRKIFYKLDINSRVVLVRLHSERHDKSR